MTEQINVISCANHSLPQYLEMQNQPNRMKRVHHSKFINSPCSQKTENRLYNIRKYTNTLLFNFLSILLQYRTTNDDGNNNSDTDTDSQLYCLRTIKVTSI